MIKKNLFIYLFNEISEALNYCSWDKEKKFFSLNITFFNYYYYY